MSEAIISQVMERVCEGCDKKQSWDVAQSQMNEQNAEEMSEWFIVAKNTWSPARGQWVKVMAHACSLSCIPVAATKIISAAFEAANQTDNIDMNALRGDLN